MPCCFDCLKEEGAAVWAVNCSWKVPTYMDSCKLQIHDKSLYQESGWSFHGKYTIQFCRTGICRHEAKYLLGVLFANTLNMAGIPLGAIKQVAWYQVDAIDMINRFEADYKCTLNQVGLVFNPNYSYGPSPAI